MEDAHDEMRASTESSDKRRSSLVLAEDHLPIAEQLRELLSEEFDVLAVVAHGEALVKAVRRLQPDVVVTDISMPGMDGMQAARQLLVDRPDLPIIFITVHDDATLARAALSLGKGYVLKASAGEELIEALNQVLKGGHFLSPALGRFEALMELPATFGKNH
ncbi:MULTISPECIES: response regulator [unclassified Dyella]|uniref:response regulator n=1 Tax=unclassified Dyella TaxID=2634549 RepID=UPI003F8F8613